MAEDRIALLELLRKAGQEGDVDFLQQGVQVLAKALMEAEVAGKIGAERYERAEGRLSYRNGYRQRPWQTRVGDVSLQVPKLREGSYFPSFLEPRRRAEKALVAVVQEAYVHGVSTRKVDALVQALGLQGVSKSEVSRMCTELDDVVTRWHTRSLEGRFPYLWLDATYLRVREDGRVVSLALVVATAVRDSGEREVVGLDLGGSEDQAFWLAFLRSLVKRGLGGVRLVVSDAHQGLRKAIAAVLTGASWQRCRVHFMRNVLSNVPKSAQSMVAATVRTIFAQSEHASASEQLEQVAQSLQGRFARVAELLREAEEDVLAHMHFPAEHWPQLASTNTLERLNKEIKRRADVVGIFPNRAAVMRLVGTVLMEQNDEWATGRRSFSQESMSRLWPTEPTVPVDAVVAR